MTERGRRDPTASGSEEKTLTAADLTMYEGCEVARGTRASLKPMSHMTARLKTSELRGV